MKTKSFLLATLLIALLPQTAHSEDKFKVGVILPLTGPLAEYGVAEKNGMELAMADNPELFNHIQFSFEDSQYDPKTALSAFTNLRTRFDPQLVYDWGATTGTALAPVANGQKFPLLSMAIDPAVAKDKKYVIRFGNHSGEYIETVVPYLRKKNFKKLAIVVVELAYTNSMAKELTAQMNQPGESVSVLATVNPGESDFKTIVAKLRHEKFDALGVYLMSGQVGEFFKLLKQQQLTPATFGTDFFESTDEIKAADGAMNGAVYPHNPVPTEFYNRYLATYKNDSQVAYAVNGYDFANLIGNEFNGTNIKMSGDEILSKLENVPPKTGQVGRYEFKNDPKYGKYFDFPIVLKTIINNKVEELK